MGGQDFDCFHAPPNSADHNAGGAAIESLLGTSPNRWGTYEDFVQIYLSGQSKEYSVSKENRFTGSPLVTIRHASDVSNPDSELAVKMETQTELGNSNLQKGRTRKSSLQKDKRRRKSDSPKQSHLCSTRELKNLTEGDRRVYQVDGKLVLISSEPTVQITHKNKKWDGRDPNTKYMGGQTETVPISKLRRTKIQQNNLDSELKGLLNPRRRLIERFIRESIRCQES